MFTTTTIQEHLKPLRTAKELTVAQAAEQCGISKSMLSMVENGTRTLGFDDTRRLLRIYGYSVEMMVQLIARKKAGKHADTSIQAIALHKHKEVLFTDGATSITQYIFADEQSLLQIAIAPKSELLIAPIQPQSTATCILLEGTLLCEATLRGRKTEEILKHGAIGNLHPMYAYHFRNHREALCMFLLTSKDSLL